MREQLPNGQWRVTLDETKQREVIEVATRRYSGHRERGTEHRYGLDPTDYGVNDECDALGAEVAAAELLGREWIDTDDPQRDRAEGDLGDGLQVRQTKYAYGRLLMHKDDADGHAFILATGKFPVYTFPGWLYGYEGKQADRWGTLAFQPDRPCFINDQTVLRRWTI